MVISYCDFNHLYDQLAKLYAFNGFLQYGQLLSRVGGGFISDFWTDYACIQDGIAGQNYYDVGRCSGMAAMLVLDAPL